MSAVPEGRSAANKRWAIPTFYPEYPEEGSERGWATAQAYRSVTVNRDLLTIRRKDVEVGGVTSDVAAQYPDSDFTTAYARGVRRLMAVLCDPRRHRVKGAVENPVLAEVWNTRQGLLYVARFAEPRPPRRSDYKHSDPLATREVRVLLPPEEGEELMAKCTHGPVIAFDPLHAIARLAHAQPRLNDTPDHVEYVDLTELSPRPVG